MDRPDLTFRLSEVKNLSTVIAEHLADLVQTGALKPGEHLVQTELASRFGVSRVAVRDALHQLRQRGLAIDVPRKGTIVRPISCQTVRDLFAVREAVESMATRLACPNLTADDLERLRLIIGEQEALARQGDLAGLLEKDWEFHRTLYDRCGNQALQEVIAGLWARARQARSLAQADAAWGEKWGLNSAARHRRVLEALEARDAGEAGRLMALSVAQAAQELAARMREGAWGGPRTGGPLTSSVDRHCSEGCASGPNPLLEEPRP